ncbi:NAD(P)H-dependent glycerol-3-phosphate dehydrogenase [Bartonella sp. TP]|uniref:NAD(P)H-dependent glycerol-3-phosphate dehydrogenase n=1 Tax=Bartonella sp. TP TaxID=3057550 RepID=UPI0025B25A30|nr:NAD(P)H-dependent glycerol-3-phosphate dehydrogenase [Bartonella sp. TP]MDN5248536.1 NAD(P)H-dependent glycerol-3-phosphate dehydrogenase [Alphaproteobacteria bacterium]WJW79541.1 NAD(P)H-dependent glycerol-3-phosphate dehydrogenase [Bartonella sp. TP]
MNYTIIGSGAWGTALANMISQKDFVTQIFGHNQQIINEINTQHSNEKYLPSIKLSSKLIGCSDLQQGLQKAQRIILAVPAQSLRSFLIENKAIISPNPAPLILCAKGIEREQGCFMSQIVAEVLPQHTIAVLSGPSFAEDVARALPTAVTLACQDVALAEQLSLELSSHIFRCYISNDILGAQIGGALKNVFAIASGAAAGYKLGDSAAAALITRSFAEMRRIGISLGGKLETLCGLSGLGDLMLTCNSSKSRNYAYGYALGTKTPPANKLVEGYFTATIAAKLCRKHNIDAPLIFAVEKLLNGTRSIEETCSMLLNRTIKIED